MSPYGKKKTWQMTRKEFEKEKRFRKKCRNLITAEEKERRAIAREIGCPVGHVYGVLEYIADLPDLMDVDHRAEVIKALQQGKNVPAEVLAEYPDLVISDVPKTPEQELCAAPRPRMGGKARQ
jgi:hypothetical protein